MTRFSETLLRKYSENIAYPYRLHGECVDSMQRPDATPLDAAGGHAVSVLKKCFEGAQCLIGAQLVTTFNAVSSGIESRDAIPRATGCVVARRLRAGHRPFAARRSS
jgi:hypothetical protein